jgi:AcrR family transcriptional regulator
MQTRTARPRTLSRPAIQAAARRIVDTEGLAALTLRRVAQEVNTGQASLYRHIADRDEMLQLLVDDFATSYPVESGRGGAEQRLIRQWKLTHDHLAAHRWVVEIVAEGNVSAASSDELSQHNRTLLVAAGVAASQAARAERALWNVTIGYLLNERGATDGDFNWALTRLVRGLLG